jgi:hypothetical protein
MCGKSFIKVDYIDCSIIGIEVEKKISYTPCKTWSTIFQSSWLKTFALQKLEASDIVLGN